MVVKGEPWTDFEADPQGHRRLGPVSSGQQDLESE